MANVKTYIWQHDEWPRFTFDHSAVDCLLADVRLSQGILIGRLSALGMSVRSNAILDAMTSDAYCSSAIEGIVLDSDEVRSSLAKHLGIDAEGLPHSGHYVDGLVEIMLNAVGEANAPLTAERIFAWHRNLFPNGSLLGHIEVGAWRTAAEPMQVVSGAMGKERIHYEAPPAADVPSMMDDLISWINEPENADPLIKSAIAHLHFVTIHPFDDGNGRIARTLTDMLISRADKLPHRYYSLSAAILSNRKSYYDILERTQHGGLDVTPWVVWFLTTTKDSIDAANERLDRVVAKHDFWERTNREQLNARQQKILNRLLDGFNGKLTSSKYAKICHCSADTALRDLNDLLAQGLLIKQGNARSTSYTL